MTVGVHQPVGSLWEVTAEPAPRHEALEGTTRADVVVVGGGYSGLVSALRIAQQGASVCVLEKSEVGSGASGRNGGQVIAGLKWDPDKLERKFGEAAVEFAGGAADDLFALIREHRIECEAAQIGWLQLAHSGKTMEACEARAAQWGKRGVGIEIESGDSVRAMVGSEEYVGGMVDYRGGTLQPLSYVRGLARAVKKCGGMIYGRSPVTSLERRNGKWESRTSNGCVMSDRVVLAANAYVSDLYPKLAQSFVSFTSCIVATEQLSQEMLESIIPCRMGISDTRRVLTYSRVFDDRLLVGGRGTYHDPKSPSDFSHIEAGMRRLFPQVSGARIAFRWSGRIAIMPDFLPRVYEPEPGLAAVHGFSGRGVAQATALGIRVGDWILSGSRDVLPMPVSPVRRIPFRRLHRLYVTTGVTLNRALDALG